MQDFRSSLLQIDPGFRGEWRFTWDDEQAISAPYPLAMIKIEGTDAAQFLHGQFISDVAAMGSPGVTFSAWCDPKGRVISTFILALTRGVFWLLPPASLKSVFLQRLKMYVLRADVHITDLTETSNNIGIDKLHMVEKGLPLLEEKTSARFLPQELNLDMLACLSYEKGCYPGQEIIARLRFRGEVKHRLYLASTHNPTSLEASTKLLTKGGDKHIGTIINAAMAKEQKLLIVLDKRHAQSNNIIVQGDPDHRVSVQQEVAGQGAHNT